MLGLGASAGGAAAPLASLCDPTSTADVSLCAYAGGDPGEIVSAAVAPAGGGLAERGVGGFRY